VIYVLVRAHFGTKSDVVRQIASWEIKRSLSSSQRSSAIQDLPKNRPLSSIFLVLCGQVSDEAEFFRIKDS